MLNNLLMPRIYLRLAFIPLVIIGIALLITRSQPSSQTNDTLSPIALLLPVNCPAPCILGIRPGVTTIEEAITRLRKNMWVKQVVASPDATQPNQVFWLWSEQAPHYLQKGQSFAGMDGEILPKADQKVSWISFYSSLTMGDIPNILGDPTGDGLM